MQKTVKILGIHFSLNERLEHEFSKPYHKNSKHSKAVRYEESSDWRRGLSF